MAASFTVLAKDVLFAQNKAMISVWNADATVVVRVYRVWMLNNQINPVTGVLTNVELRKFSAHTGGTALTPTPHDSTVTLPANITAATNASFTATSMYRRVLWSTDEPITTATAMTLDEFETFMPINCIWSQGYADSTVEPITLRQNEGFGVVATGAFVGQADLMLEFTTV